jgi:CyaY protein
MATDNDYLALVDRALYETEELVERDFDSADCARSGRVLTIEFEGGAKVVVNAQAPMHQLWLASRLGARHFVHDGQVWRDTRTNEEFFAIFKAVARAHES